MFEPDILPSSKTKVIKGGYLGKWGLWWIPIYCANCGADGGSVPEETCNFAFYLCPPCYEKWGLTAGLMAEPETVFWHRVNQEMESKYGRVLTPQELMTIIDADSSPLASLLKEGATILKGV